VFVRISRETSVGVGLIAAAWLTPVLTGVQALVVGVVLIVCVGLTEVSIVKELRVANLRIAALLCVVALLGVTYYNHAGQGVAKALTATFLEVFKDPTAGPLTAFAALAILSVSAVLVQMNYRRYWYAAFSAAGAPFGLALTHTSHAAAFALFAVVVCAGTALTPLEDVPRRFGGSAPSVRLWAMAAVVVCCAAALALGPGAAAMSSLGHTAKDAVEQRFEAKSQSMETQSLSVPKPVARQLARDLAAGRITPAELADALGENGVSAQLQALSQMGDPRMLQQVLDQGSTQPLRASDAGGTDGLQMRPGGQTSPVGGASDTGTPPGGSGSGGSSSADGSGGSFGSSSNAGADTVTGTDGGSGATSGTGSSSGAGASTGGSSGSGDTGSGVGTSTGGSGGTGSGAGTSTDGPLNGSSGEGIDAGATAEGAVGANEAGAASDAGSISTGTSGTGAGSTGAVAPNTSVASPASTEAGSSGALATWAIALAVLALLCLAVLVTAASRKRHETTENSPAGALHIHPIVVAWKRADSAIEPLVGPGRAARTFTERHLQLRRAAPELSATHVELANLADAAVFEGPLPADAALRAGVLAGEIRGRVPRPSRRIRARANHVSTESGDKE
jgi:hypothetical protein